MLDQTFQIPTDFNIQEHLAMAFESESKVLMRLRFAPSAAHVAHDLRGTWETLETQADGSVTVTLAMPDVHWATSMALSFGPIVTVLEPTELRTSVRKWANAIAEQYEIQK